MRGCRIRTKAFAGVLGAGAILLAGVPESLAAYDTMRIAVDLVQPIYVTTAPGRPDDLFIVERGGAIKIMHKNTGAIEPTPFLSIPNVNLLGEGALVSVAFHPDYATNGRFYVSFTTDPENVSSQLTTHIQEYTVLDPVNSPDTVDPTPRELFKLDQPQSVHNGGWMGFSPTDPNHYLYIMMGDGGGGYDSHPVGHTPGTGNAQDITDNLYGKILRIDPLGNNSANGNYGIPADNPFVGIEGDDEIWAYGIRNAFRGNFDSLTGDLYFGDVGQATREEIDFQPASSAGGENYGWRLREGSIATPSPGIGGPPPPGNVDPIYDYAHGSGDFQGNAVTGGLLYRGPATELYGKYIFGDFVSGNLWMFDPLDPAGTITRINDDLAPNSGVIDNIVAFTEDTYGNMYIVDIGGEIFRVGLRGDLNGDGFVGLSDLDTVLSHWNEGEPPAPIPGDLDGDMFVGLADLDIVLGHWNLNVTPGDLALGDVDGDGFVGLSDLDVILGAWNTGAPPSHLVMGDVNGDGFVGLDDLDVVLSNWNTGTPPQASAAIPEPGVFSVLAVGLGGVNYRRVRHRRS